jgi:hypothetical protein
MKVEILHLSFPRPTDKFLKETHIVRGGVNTHSIRHSRGGGNLKNPQMKEIMKGIKNKWCAIPSFPRKCNFEAALLFRQSAFCIFVVHCPR